MEDIRLKYEESLEKRKAANKAYYDANREKILASKAAYHVENREHRSYMAKLRRDAAKEKKLAAAQQ